MVKLINMNRAVWLNWVPAPYRDIHKLFEEFPIKPRPRRRDALGLPDQSRSGARRLDRLRRRRQRLHHRCRCPDKPSIAVHSRI